MELQVVTVSGSALRHALVWALLVSAVACRPAAAPEVAATRREVLAAAPVAPAPPPSPEPLRAEAFALPQVAVGTPVLPEDATRTTAHYAVATAHPLATRAAEDALKAGGSAVDALVAASFMLTVVQPRSTGIGGGGFAVVWPGDGTPPRAWDFRETAPAATQVADYLDAQGHAIAKLSQRHGLAIATPGYVAGLAALHARYGRRPWAELVRPAAEVAARGFSLGRESAQAIVTTLPDLDRTAQALLAPGGKPMKQGEILRMPALARTLERIAREGPDAFYKGPVAEDIVRTARAAGGKITLADLAGYRVREMAPLEGDAFGGRVVTMPQPSAGGAQVLAMGELLDEFGKSTLLNQGQRIHAWAEAMRRSFLLRIGYSGDSDHPAATLDDAFPRAARRAAAAAFFPTYATSSASLSVIASPKKGTPHVSAPNTSHVSIIDSRGMAVSSTHTINLLFGSGIIAPESGVILNNEMDDFTFYLTDSNYFGLAGSAENLARPGARPVSSMSPLILLKDGKPKVVAGTPGGTRIPTTVAWVLYWSRSMGDLARAVAMPRIHHQAWPDRVEIERGFSDPLARTGSDEMAESLARAGHTVERRPPWCNVQAVALECPDGLPCDQPAWTAVSDPRGEGGAVAR
jgi:gamma-glutamyltranspeptidase/glutathione hydrolase